MTPAFGLRQFVHLRGHDQTRDPKPLQPVPRVPIDVQTGMPAVDEHEHAAETRVRHSIPEVSRRQRVEFLSRRIAAAGVSVARQIDEVERRFALDRDPIEIRQARFARRGARARNLLLDERVNQGRLADVGSTHHRDFGEAVLGKPFGYRGAGNKFGSYLQKTLDRRGGTSVPPARRVYSPASTYGFSVSWRRAPRR